jgi:hypothetical protein
MRDVVLGKGEGEGKRFGGDEEGGSAHSIPNASMTSGIESKAGCAGACCCIDDCARPFMLPWPFEPLTAGMSFIVLSMSLSSSAPCKKTSSSSLYMYAACVILVKLSC